MIRLIPFEIKKMVLRPSSIIVIFIILIVNGITIFLDIDGSIFQRQDIEMRRMEQSQYEGEINQKWTSLIKTKFQAVKENPNNLMSQDEMKKVKKDYIEKGYTKEHVNNLDNAAFLKPELINGLPYGILLDADYASGFYNNAHRYAIFQGEIHRSEYAGKKGEVLAVKAEEMYDNLATDHTAYYDYNLGWIKLISMQYLMPFTLGIFLIITLSASFSGEYSQKTDSLLLSSKHGKSKLIYAKIIAAYLVTVGFWLVVQIMNLMLVVRLFSLQGAHTFVQDWSFNNSPFPFTQLTNYLAVTLMSFIGLLFYASVILLVSAKTKGPFISLLISSMVLLFPVTAIGGFIGELIVYMPSQILIGVNHFMFFRAYYIFGNAILMQYITPLVAIILTVIMVPIACRTFQQRQVEN